MTNKSHKAIAVFIYFDILKHWFLTKNFYILDESDLQSKHRFKISYRIVICWITDKIVAF